MSALKGRIVLELVVDGIAVVDSTGSLPMYGDDAVRLSFDVFDLQVANDAVLTLQVQQSVDIVKFFDVGAPIEFRAIEQRLVDITGVTGLVIRIKATLSTLGAPGETAATNFSLETTRSVPPLGILVPPAAPSMAAALSKGEIPLILPAKFRPPAWDGLVAGSTGAP